VACEVALSSIVERKNHREIMNRRLMTCGSIQEREQQREIVSDMSGMKEGHEGRNIVVHAMVYYTR
jgi:hypothetical protein